MRALSAVTVPLLLLATLLLAACGGDGGAPSSHTEELGGVGHRPGFNDPLANCAGCHGSDLRGGEGPSCYRCHNNSDHSVNRSGRLHRPGATASCAACHGPANRGGLGPACSTCH